MNKQAEICPDSGKDAYGDPAGHRACLERARRTLTRSGWRIDAPAGSDADRPADQPVTASSPSSDQSSCASVVFTMRGVSARNFGSVR